MKRLDLTGQVFGRLKVLSYAHTKNGRAYWNCLCECGNKTIVQRGNLRFGSVKSCGCLWKEINAQRMKKLIGEKNNKWKGDYVQKDAAHDWVRVRKTKPQQCEKCGKNTIKLELSFNKHPERHTRNPYDYEYLCRKCHMVKDGLLKPKPPSLTKHQAHRVRELYKVGAGSHQELAKLFKVSVTPIRAAIKYQGPYERRCNNNG